MEEEMMTTTIVKQKKRKTDQGSRSRYESFFTTNIIDACDCAVGRSLAEGIAERCLQVE